MDESRRNFFKNYFRDTVKLVTQVHQSFEEGKSDADYFQSFESSYPLVSEYMAFTGADEIKALNIITEGKTNFEIAQEIYRTKKKT